MTKYVLKLDVDTEHILEMVVPGVYEKVLRMETLTHEEQLELDDSALKFDPIMDEILNGSDQVLIEYDSETKAWTVLKSSEHPVVHKDGDEPPEVETVKVPELVKYQPGPYDFHPLDPIPNLVPVLKPFKDRI